MRIGASGMFRPASVAGVGSCKQIGSTLVDHLDERGMLAVPPAKKSSLEVQKPL
jgi:hypothetical protein